MLLTDLAKVARTSGLEVVELAGWANNYSGGSFNPLGVLCHHTGSYDGTADYSDDLSYAKWLAFTGRSDLPPPLCNLALSAEGVVFVCSSGNANHAGQAKATGPMPSASDGNSLYVGIEAMNSGSQGWGTMGKDARGNPITQWNAYVALCAALCNAYVWPASHVRGHKETSCTGKWDPGEMDMEAFRSDVAAWMKNPQRQEDDVQLDEDIAKWCPDHNEEGDETTVGQTLNQARGYAEDAYKRVKALEQQVDTIEHKVDQILDAVVGK